MDTHNGIACAYLTLKDPNRDVWIFSHEIVDYVKTGDISSLRNTHQNLILE